MIQCNYPLYWWWCVTTIKARSIPGSSADISDYLRSHRGWAHTIDPCARVTVCANLLPHVETNQFLTVQMMAPRMMITRRRWMSGPSTAAWSYAAGVKLTRVQKLVNPSPPVFLSCSKLTFHNTPIWLMETELRDNMPSSSRGECRSQLNNIVGTQWPTCSPHWSLCCHLQMDNRCICLCCLPAWHLAQSQKKIKYRREEDHITGNKR